MAERDQLTAVLATLEAYRGLLGDAAVRAVVEPLRNYLGEAQLPKAERRIVSVMFADLTGFTALAGTHDPEEVRDLINACFSQLVPVVERFGGTVDKFIGDAVMVLFGAPIAHENDAERAIRAGLALFEALESFNQAHQIALGLHIGINTGLVVAGGIGPVERQEYSVIGDAVNIASRLADLAEPGTLLIGEATYQAVANLIQAEERLGMRIKGKAESITAYTVVGLRAAPGPERGIDGLSAPLIGREHERLTLEAAFAGLQTGQGAALLLIGEAGLGKSRLIRELSLTATASHHWYECRGVAYDAARPYSQFIQLLRRMLDLSDTAPASAISTAVATALAPVPGLPNNAQSVLTSLLDPLATPALDGEAFKRALHAVVRAWWSHLAAERPLVLVFDDLHWSDSASATLMQALWGLLPSTPILFLGAARPDWSGLPALAADQRAQTLTLHPLAEHDSNRLVDQLLTTADIPTALRQRVLQQSEGNPFFVEEIVRALIEGGAVIRQDDRWVANASADQQPSVPTTLQALLIARIDRLPEAARTLLQHAAVIGRSFSVAILERIVARDDLESLLQLLVRSDLIRPFGGITFAFRHALTQEAVYQSILLQERRVLHGRVGQALEALHPQILDDLAPQLAFHFAQAHMDDRALHYELRAADDAYDLYALDEACHHYIAALALDDRSGCASTAQCIHAATRLARALELQGRFQDAHAAYAALEARGHELDEPRLRIAAIGIRATLYAYPNPTQDLSRALELAEQSLTLGTQLADHAAIARALWNQALVFGYRADNRQATDAGLRSLAIARTHGLREQEAFTLNDLSRWTLAIGDLSAAIAYSEAARDLWREFNNLPMLCDNLNSAAIVYFLLGHTQRARAIASEAHAISLRTANPWAEGNSTLWLAMIAHATGDLQLARSHFLQLRHLATEHSMTIYRVMGGADLAWLHTLFAEHEAADDALAWAAQGDDHIGANFGGIVLGHRARIAIQRGRIAAARNELEAAMQQLDLTQNNSFGAIIIPLAAAQLAVLDGDYAAVVALIERFQTRAIRSGIHQYDADLALFRAIAQANLGAAEDAIATLRRGFDATNTTGAARVRPLIALALAHLIPAEATAWRAEAERSINARRNLITDPELRRRFDASPLAQALNAPPELAALALIPV